MTKSKWKVVTGSYTFFFLTEKWRSKEVISTIKLRQVVEAKVNLLSLEDSNLEPYLKIIVTMKGPVQLAVLLLASWVLQCLFQKCITIIIFFPVSLKVTYVYQELHTKSTNALFWMYFGGIYFIAQLLAIHWRFLQSQV